MDINDNLNLSFIGSKARKSAQAILHMDTQGNAYISGTSWKIALTANEYGMLKRF